jgi:hypothetical protein
MTKPTTLTFGHFLILLGDGASPEVFAEPCGLTSKGFAQTANTQDTNVPDCDDPDAPSFVERAIESLSGEISGSGVLAMESFPVWDAFYKNAISKNVRIVLDTTLANNGGYYEGAFLLTRFGMTAQNKGKVQVELTMVSDGQWIFTPALV